MLAERLQKVRALMAQMGLEQLLVTAPQSIYYLTGEWVMPLDRLDALVLTDSEVSMLCYNLAQIHPDGCKVVVYSDIAKALPLLKSLLKNAVTGVDGEMPSRFCLPLTELMPGIRLKVTDCVERARMVKDKDEIERLTFASALTDTVFNEVFASVRPGMTENEIARLFANAFQNNGAGVFQGVPMAACGAGTADVHHTTCGNVLKRGDAIMVDTGMRINGYYSDMTRTVFMGEISDKQKKIYDIVLEANLAAIAAVKPGMLFHEVDAIARDVIVKAGYGDFFTHKTSHGIGIDCHELPTDRTDMPFVLEPGMAFSIEPGPYFPGEFGVRIEDLAIMTEKGVSIVTHCDKNIRIL